MQLESEPPKETPIIWYEPIIEQRGVATTKEGIFVTSYETRTTYKIHMRGEDIPLPYEGYY